MFHWLGQRFGKRKEKIKQSPARKSGDSGEQDILSPQTSFVSPSVLPGTGIAGAERMPAGIKMRAQVDTETEAARIIAQAKLEVQEIKGRAEIAVQREVADILSAAKRNAQITEMEAKQKAMQFLIRASEELEKEITKEYEMAYTRLSSSLQSLMNEVQSIDNELKKKTAQLRESTILALKEYEATLLDTPREPVPTIGVSAAAETQLSPDTTTGQQTEKSVQLEEEAGEKVKETTQLKKVVEERVKEPPQLPKEAAASPVEEIAEIVKPPIIEERAAMINLDSQANYSGEVDLIIAAPVELTMVSKFYNYLQTIPELKVLYTRGSWDQGTTITVVPDKPMPLVSIISRAPDVGVTLEPIEGGVLRGGKSSVLSGGDKKGTRKIRVVLK
ncbi:MAG: hypothetical protein V1932_04355 [Chloroflexota bacterium]